MLRALEAELTKLKRATLPLWTLATVCGAPTLSNVFATANSGWTETTLWSTFVGLGPMSMGTWYGILLFGLITAFLFGREYSEGVATNVLTTPTRREYFVLAKFAVLAGWVAVLALLAVVAQVVWASALGLDGATWSSVWSCLGDMLTVALLIFLTLPLVALVAVMSRGVFAPMIFSAFGFAAGMLGGIAGWGDWLPWAMPTSIAGSFMGPMGLASQTKLDGGSWVIAVGVFVLGLAALLYWVNHADSKS
ncbi:MAG: hypothetical protein CVT66_11405 [Actinobacteria bacterium HGW-Actinobacteria-6]|nr:MAG: hypothetical protein CVT66_11405 [Actinobacteria bacterium HGW-Actinobacteria-6]